MFVLKILLGILACLWISWLWSRRRYYKLMLQVRGPIGLPVFGILYKIKSLEDVFLYSRKMLKTYKFPTLCWAGPYPIYVMIDPQTIQEILTSPHCVNKADHYAVLGDVFGHGLLSIPNPTWAAHRKLLNPAFCPENLRNYLGIFNTRAKAFMQDFEATYRGNAIDMMPLLQRVSMNFALETTMGLKSMDKSSTDDESMEEKLYKFYHYLTDRIMSMALMPWLRLKFVQDLLPTFSLYTSYRTQLKKFFQNVIYDKLNALEAKEDSSQKILKTEESNIDDFPKKRNHIFVDIAVELLRMGKFNINEVEAHANNIVAGASETTAITAAHALMFLAMYPQYQVIAFEEMIPLFPDRDDIIVNDDDLEKLVYLEMVINETMRVIPTVPVAARCAASDVHLSSGITLPKGIHIVIDIFDLHRNESVWGPNACVFNPENFLPENMMDKHPYAFIPFTNGIRSCIGRRYAYNATKVLLVMLLRKYSFSTMAKFEELRYEPTITSRLINPPLLKANLREK